MTPDDNLAWEDAVSLRTWSVAISAFGACALAIVIALYLVHR
ncbi:hypothetical protein V1281_004237 [Nitrobacteraceae bacterium AZCC 2161]